MSHRRDRWKHMTRREALRVGVLASGAALLAACGQQAPAPAATAKPAEPVKPAAPAATSAPAAPATPAEAAKPVASAPTSVPAAQPTVPASGQAATAAPAKPAAGKRGGTLNIAMANFFEEVWLPHKSPRLTDGPQGALYDYLLYYDPEDNFKLKPGLAESWSHKDFREFTFKIRQGVKWGNGQGEVTAEDVAYTIQAYTRDEAKSTDTPYWRTRAKNMQVTDKYTLTFKLDAVDPVLHYQLSNWRRTVIMPKAYIESVGDDKAEREPVGSGAYKRGAYTPGSTVELLPAEGQHWRQPAQWEKLVFSNIKESSTRLALLDTGRAELAQIEMEQLDDVKKRGFDIFSTEGTAQVALMFGGLFKKDHPKYQGKDPWQDIRVREAMALAVDREAINKTLFAGLGSFEPTMGNNVAPLATVANMKVPYDPDRATKLIKEAGQVGFAPNIVSYPISGLPQITQVVQVIAAYWEAIGLKPKITPMDMSSFRELWLKDETNGYVWPWNNPVQPLFEARFEKFFYGGDIGFQIYSDDHLDDVYKELGQVSDPERRAKMLADAQIYLREQWAAVPILNVPQMMFAAPKGKIGSWKPMRAGECTNWDYIAPPA